MIRQSVQSFGNCLKTISLFILILYTGTIVASPGSSSSKPRNPFEEDRETVPTSPYNDFIDFAKDLWELGSDYYNLRELFFDLTALEDNRKYPNRPGYDFQLLLKRRRERLDGTKLVCTSLLTVLAKPFMTSVDETNTKRSSCEYKCGSRQSELFDFMGLRQTRHPICYYNEYKRYYIIGKDLTKCDSIGSSDQKNRGSTVCSPTHSDCSDVCTRSLVKKCLCMAGVLSLAVVNDSQSELPRDDKGLEIPFETCQTSELGPDVSRLTNNWQVTKTERWPYQHFYCKDRTEADIPSVAVGDKHLEEMLGVH